MKLSALRVGRVYAWDHYSRGVIPGRLEAINDDGSVSMIALDPADHYDDTPVDYRQEMSFEMLGGKPHIEKAERITTEWVYHQLRENRLTPDHLVAAQAQAAGLSLAGFALGDD